LEIPDSFQLTILKNPVCCELLRRTPRCRDDFACGRLLRSPG